MDKPFESKEALFAACRLDTRTNLWVYVNDYRGDGLTGTWISMACWRPTNPLNPMYNEFQRFAFSDRKPTWIPPLALKKP